MAHPSDLGGEVDAVLSEAGANKAKKTDADAMRRVQAMRLRVAGLTYEQIGERLGITSSGALALVKRTLERAENVNVQQERELENQRLDVAQSVIWARVLEGDIKAIDAYLRISNHRIRINGLAAPTQIDISMGVRHEMEEALANLERMVQARPASADISLMPNRNDDVMDVEFTDVDEGNDDES